jgi:RHS repeat-associated protein
VYDAFGNLTQLAGSTVTVDAATNRLNATGMAYDVFGSMTQQPVGLETYRYGYDEVQMLRSLEPLNGAQLLRTDYYVYDANDERVRTYTDEGGSISSTYVIRDLGGRSLREWREVGNTWTVKDDYIYGADGLTAAYTGTTLARVHFHNDHLGTPRLVTGAGGSVYERSNYFAFGREATPYLSTDLTKKFTGHHRDMYTAEHNLDYMHARYYSAGLGRFLSTDPGRDWNPRAPQSWNLYGYVRNSPLTFIDPSGLASFRFSGSITVEADAIPATMDELWMIEMLWDYYNFVSGASNAFASNALFGRGRVDQPNGAYQYGQIYGDAASVLFGGLEMLGGTGGEIGGLALDATGIGALIGVPVQVVSGGLVMHGSTTTAIGAANLMSGVKQRKEGKHGTFRGRDAKRANDVDVKRVLKDLGKDKDGRFRDRLHNELRKAGMQGASYTEILDLARGLL